MISFMRRIDLVCAIVTTKKPSKAVVRYEHVRGG